MKSLKIVQNWAKVIKVLLIIAIVILSIALVGGLITFIALHNAEFFDSINGFLIESESEPLSVAIVPELLIGLISIVFSLVLCILALKYLNKEIQDGTPFNHGSAKQLFWLGIISLCSIFIFQLVAGIVVLAYGLKIEDVSVSISGFSVACSIGVILLSQIFKYGADIKKAL